jgi:hypothetical protein
MSLSGRRRLRYPVGVAALVVGIFVLQGVSTVVARRVVADGLPAWLPTFGTAGQTVTAYVLAGNAYTSLFVPTAAFWLGMRYSRGDA